MNNSHEATGRNAKLGTPKRRRILKVASGLLALLFIGLVIDYRAYPYGAAISGPSLNTGENGLWLRYTWYFGQHSELEVKQLSRQLHDRQIRYAYFHVRFIGKAGKLAYHYTAQARALTTSIHRDCPGAKLLAWVYVSNESGESSPHIADAKTRSTMISEAQWLVNNCGFDGVQWDVEPCADGDTAFLDLLKETRAALPAGKLLSVATPMWQPATLRRYGWSDEYFISVAADCDQLAVMCYDSGFYMPRAYVWLVRQQAIHVTRSTAAGNPKCRVILGVPTYGAGLPSHNPHAENISFALRGVREGLGDLAANRSVFGGVSPFADYTTSDEDWKRYRALWLTAPASQK